MATEIKTINTIEELVARALERGESDTRYKLDVWSQDLWDDPAVGTAWMQAKGENTSEATNWAQRLAGSYAEQHRMQGEIEQRWLDENPRPASHWGKTYTMVRAGNYGRASFKFGTELGEQVLAVWTKRNTSRFGKTMEPTGMMTVAGLLKRLGKTDVGEQVKSAEEKLKAEQAKNVRNNRRREVTRQLELLRKAIVAAKEAGAFSGIDPLLMTIPALETVAGYIEE